MWEKDRTKTTERMQTSGAFGQLTGLGFATNIFM